MAMVACRLSLNYVRRWRATASWARDSAAEMPLPCKRSFSPSAMTFKAAMSASFS